MGKIENSGFFRHYCSQWPESWLMQKTNWVYEGMWVLKVKVISLLYIFQVLYVLCFTRPQYQVSVYRTIGPMVSSPEPKAHRWAYSIPMVRRPSSVRRPSVVVRNAQRSSSPKPLVRSKPNFMWSLLGLGERYFVRGIWVTWPRWPPCPYMVKTLQKSSSPEPAGRFSQNLVCSIGDSSPS